MYKYLISWVGQCKNEARLNKEYCGEHLEEFCVSCGEKATHQCGETGQFVCGAPLCDNCEHTIAEDGTNGGIGFFQCSPFPEGYGAHCKKTEQVYRPWYARENPFGEEQMK